jgi:uncharacterized protein with GYD domain
MATFISLVNLTEQGVKDCKASPDRAAKFKTMAEKVGVKVKDIYWTMGAHDVVIIMEAAEDEAAVAAMLGLASLGNVKTQTLRAFNAEQMKKIVSKL